MPLPCRRFWFLWKMTRKMVKRIILGIQKSQCYSFWSPRWCQWRLQSCRLVHYIILAFVSYEKGTKPFKIRVPLSSTQTPSVQQISSIQGPHLFGSQNPSVQHQKPLSSTLKSLSSTLKTPKFSTPLISHQKPLISSNPSVQHQNPSVQYQKAKLRGFWWGTEGGVVYGTEGFVSNWGVFDVFWCGETLKRA